VNSVAQNLPSVFDHGGCGFVAGRFNCEDAHMRFLLNLLQLFRDGAFVVRHV